MTDTIKVLYVEDNNADALLLDFYIEQQVNGHPLVIDIANNIALAHKMYATGEYQAVLLDWNLPGGSGLEVAERIRQSDPNIPIIFISGSDFTDEQKLAVAPFNILACIKKEYDQTHIDKVHSLLLKAN